MAVFLEGFVEEFGVGEEGLGLNGGGEDVAVGVEDGAATGGQGLRHVLLSLRAADGVLTADGLEEGDATEQGDEHAANGDEDEGGADRGEAGHRSPISLIGY